MSHFSRFHALCPKHKPLFYAVEGKQFYTYFCGFVCECLRLSAVDFVLLFYNENKINALHFIYYRQLQNHLHNQMYIKQHANLILIVFEKLKLWFNYQFLVIFCSFFWKFTTATVVHSNWQHLTHCMFRNYPPSTTWYMHFEELPWKLPNNQANFWETYPSLRRWGMLVIQNLVMRKFPLVWV